MMTFKVDNLKDMHASLQDFSEYLRSCGIAEDDVFYGRLVGCELVGNVIRHCGVMAHFLGSVEGNDIVITVSSDGTKSFKLCPELPDALAESGRGLYIVNVVCGGDITFDGNGITAKIRIHRIKQN